MMKSHRTNDSNIQSLTSQRGRKGSIFGGFKNMLAGTGDTGRGKDAMAAMLGAGAEALPAKSEEEQRKFFEDLKRCDNVSSPSFSLGMRQFRSFIHLRY